MAWTRRKRWVTQWWLWVQDMFWRLDVDVDVLQNVMLASAQ